MDLSQPVTLPGGPHDWIIHIASPALADAASYRAVFLDGIRHLLAEAGTARLLFTSSTSVYAQTGGERVDETSAAEPTSETGRILRQTEEIVLAAGGIVARLAGIYGPGRAVLLRRLFNGEARLEGGGQRFINAIHRDDIATGILRIVESVPPGPEIYNIADDGALTQRHLYEVLSARFNLPLPPEAPINPARKRGWTHKQVSNTKLKMLGWHPAFPTMLDAAQEGTELIRLAASEI
jgi:nucleoside-diphosphate-sugar epimerase